MGPFLTPGARGQAEHRDVRPPRIAAALPFIIYNYSEGKARGKGQ
jgi:hypothetical protein